MSTTLAPELEPDHEAPPSRRPRRRRWLVAVASVLVVLLAAAGGGIWWFLHGDAPAAVNLDSATQAVAEGTGSASASAAAATDVSGSWSVDTSIGTFSFEDSTGTFVGFRIDEQLSGIGSTTAVGRTPDVTGTITVDRSTVTAATIEADMSAITTNDSRRDHEVQEALETSSYPTATFVLTEPIDLGSAATSGEATTVTAVGDLTIHGVTTKVSIPLQVQLVDDTIVLVGSLDVTFSDYGVSVPTAPIVLSAADHGVVELQLFFTKG
jgi:polyisoprenoid-binding protein YceI